MRQYCLTHGRPSSGRSFAVSSNKLDNRADRTVLLDYELAISCALGALVILRIIHLHQESRGLRDLRRSIERGINGPRDPTGKSQAAAQDSQVRPAGKPWPLYDRLIVLALILALLWFAGRIWLQT